MSMAAAVWASMASSRRRWLLEGGHSAQQSLKRSLAAFLSQLQLLPQSQVGLACTGARWI